MPRHPFIEVVVDFSSASGAREIDKRNTGSHFQCLSVSIGTACIPFGRRRSCPEASAPSCEPVLPPRQDTVSKRRCQGGYRQRSFPSFKWNQIYIFSGCACCSEMYGRKWIYDLSIPPGSCSHLKSWCVRRMWGLLLLAVLAVLAGTYRAGGVLSPPVVQKAPFRTKRALAVA